eukprot:7479449-Heterocapsa_arctica.AAC.1
MGGDPSRGTTIPEGDVLEEVAELLWMGRVIGPGSVGGDMRAEVSVDVDQCGRVHGAEGGEVGAGEPSGYRACGPGQDG